MDRINAKDFSGLLGWLLIAAALAALSAYVSVSALVIPLVIIYMIVRFGTAGGVLGFAVLGAAAVFSPATAAAFLAGFAPVSITAAIAIRRRWRFRDSVIASSIAALTGVVLCVGLLQLIKGLSPTDYAVQRISGLFSLLGDSEIHFVYQTMRGPDVLLGAITQEAVLATPRMEAIDTMLATLRELINYSFVIMMLIYSLLWGLLCYLIPRRYAARRGIPVKLVPVFSEYALPKYFWVAFIVSYLAAIMLDRLGLSAFGMLEPTISSVYSFVFTIQALSFLDYFYKERGLRKSTRVAMHIGTVLIFGSYLMWAGIFENVVRFRSRDQEKGGADF